jgi:3-oxoacyl-(acyl-carrier-protein) synthase
LNNSPIYITSFASVSTLGKTADQVWNSYLNPKSYITAVNELSSNLDEASITEIKKLSLENKKYKVLDNTVLYALFAGRKAFKLANWDKTDVVGINMGSSRGATELFEKFHADFIKKVTTTTLSSPSTTLGNISTWLASDLQIDGPIISHSITCSTALHSILNGIAWLNSGMSNKFMVGGSEAANTAFTIAQMKALKIYSSREDDLPCQSLKFDKTENTMVLGEGAAIFCLQKEKPKSNCTKITGYGFATEIVNHSASISTNADCFQKSMAMALNNFEGNIDAIVMHAPGTIKGDSSELNAIKAVFNENIPALTSNKWKIGHALGASGAFSLEMAILMLQNQLLIESPFYNNKVKPKNLKNILVNAVGFGGNAVSIIVSV